MYLLYFRHDEFQYLDGLRHIMKRGMQKGDRTGVGTKSVFGVQQRYSLRDGESRPCRLACRLVGTKPLSEPMLEYCKLDP